MWNWSELSPMIHGWRYSFVKGASPFLAAFVPKCRSILARVSPPPVHERDEIYQDVETKLLEARKRV